METKFGTDGIRGVAGNTLICETVYYACRALAFLCKRNNPSAKILVAKDNRESGSMLECSVASGITSSGVDSYLLGVLPTGAASILTRLYGADACVVISASHNPPEYNGIKIFDSFGKKICDEFEKFIEKNIALRCKDLKTHGFGKVLHASRSKQDYENFCCKLWEEKCGLSVVLDCSNGATQAFVKNIFSNYVKKLYIVGNSKDGAQINNMCGSTYPENLHYFVKKFNADIGFAFDGDGDRIIASDNKRIYTGDALLCVLARDFLRQGKLCGGGVAGTLMTNLACEKLLAKEGIELFRADVGDKYLLKTMLEKNLNLGGEDSGHIIIRSQSFTGDGIITAINLLNILSRNSKTMSELTQDYIPCPSKLINIYANEQQKELILKNESLLVEIEECKKIIPGGRILVRKSGTEDKIRIMVEYEDEHLAEQIAQRIAGKI